MHVLRKDKISPIVSPHGEIIHELIGRTVGESTQRHSVAYVTIPPGKSSLHHSHLISEESYYILEGTARMLLADEETTVVPGDAILIPSQKVHQIINAGETDLAFIAFCVPAWEPSDTKFPETMNELAVNNLPEPFSWDDMLELYKLFDSSVKNELDFFFRYFHFYVGLLSAILAVNITGLLNITSGDPRGLVLLIGPVLILLLSRIGYDNVQAFYRRFTEAWVTKLNVESMLNLRSGDLTKQRIQYQADASRGGGFIPQIEWRPLKEMFVQAEKEKWSAEKLASRLAEVGTTLSNTKRTFILFGSAGVVLAIITVVTVL